jgi:UDP-N-acetylmuramoylalanine--D-glutamate ligase
MWFERKTKHLRDQNIHVVGIAGTEGAATLEFLVEKVGCKKVTAHEQSEEREFMKSFRAAHFARPWEDMKPMGRKLTQFDQVTYRYGGTYLTGIDGADIIFVPQSWYLYAQNAPLKELTKKLSSFMRLYFDLFPGKIIGVTGSNGKTTTGNMIYGILERAHGVDSGFTGSVYFAGNDRRNEQVLNKVDTMKEEDWLVLEISNRHLKVDLGKSPEISVITNITPNHLPEYKDFNEYKKCKESLLSHMTKKQVAVLNLDDEESKLTIEHLDHEVFCFSTREELSHGAYLSGTRLMLKHAEGEEVVLKVDELSVKGKHNISNALAAIAACYLAGVSTGVISEGLRDFDGVPRRLELVRKLTPPSASEVSSTAEDRSGRQLTNDQLSIINEEETSIEFYNDLASTTPESTIAALYSFDQGTVILICGGESKGSDYEELAVRLKEQVKWVVFLDSPLADELRELLGSDFVRLCTDTASTMTEAVQLASGRAEDGNKVVLSPAGDYGWFNEKMEDRKKFRSLVGKL